MRKFLLAILLILSGSCYASQAIIGWGNNDDSQITTIEATKKIKDIDAGPWSSCAVFSDGSFKCQGCATPVNNFDQCDAKIAPEGWVLELGGMRTTNKPLANIATSFGHTCAINVDGQVECWGCRRPRLGGQCAVAHRAQNVGSALIAKEPLNGLRTIDVSEMHTCAVMKDGSIECWGCEEPENYGQCSPPKSIQATGLSISLTNSCAALEGGGITCWGMNDLQQSQPPKTNEKIKDIAIGYGYGAAVTKSNKLLIWGKSAPDECSKSESCTQAKAITASDDYLCITEVNDEKKCMKTKNNAMDVQSGLERNPYEWLDTKEIESISIDNGTSIAIISSALAKKHAKELPKFNENMAQEEYILKKITKQPSDAWKNSHEDYVNHIGMKFKRIPAGSFLMGSCSSKIECNKLGMSFHSKFLKNETPVRKVKIEKSFQMGVFEVTAGEFKKYIQANPKIQKDFSNINKVPNHYPMIMISWDQAKDFIKWLNTSKPFEDKATYSLPSESQWEYAARSGASTIFWNSDNLSNTNSANCSDCSESPEMAPKPVGSYAPNGFGLYDMHGNVDEWVEDCVDTHGYEKYPTTEQPYVTQDCKTRGARGGSWEYTSHETRSAWRDFYTPDSRTWEQGFRIIRTPN